MKPLCYWAYKFVHTRAFNHCEGMLIPLIDNLNHQDVHLENKTFTNYFLSYKARPCEKVMITDYRDFSGEPHQSNGPIKGRTYLNRLEKYYRWYGDDDFQFQMGVWQIKNLASEFESSSDEECPLHQDVASDESSLESESSEESDNEDIDFKIEIGDDKVMVAMTNEHGGFRAGQQVSHCYGRLSNFDLLIVYGFALLPNRYDSVILRVRAT